jgi:hypothetical protein
MHVRTFVAALIAVQAAAPALAQEDPVEGPTRCFGRAYSVEHLADHPGQRVVEMMLVLHPYTYDGRESAGATVRAMVRDRYGEFFANSAICDMEAGGGYACGIECDGGRFAVDLAADGTATLRNEDWGFVLHGGCEQEVAEGREIVIEADAEHRAFSLYPLPPEACPASFWEVYDPDSIWPEQ